MPNPRRFIYDQTITVVACRDNLILRRWSEAQADRLSGKRMQKCFKVDTDRQDFISARR
jgi:hypothetical protein